MSKKVNLTEQIFKDAIEKGVAPEVSEIIAIRATSKKAIVLFKSVFWVGVAIFNLALWVPLPIELNRTLLYVVAFIVLVIAVVVPIIGLRKHQATLELLKVNKDVLKKKTASEAGRVYIDQVKKQGRPFVNVEFELLEGSKWEQKAGEEN